MDYETSFAGIDPVTKKPIPYLTWQSRPKNAYAAQGLEFWLGVWATTQEKAGLNSIGVSFKSAQAKVPSRRFVPTSLTHQVHQYQSKKNGWENGKTGFGGAGDCNCLMYLEMVDNRPKPKDPRLIWSGNFSTLPRNPTDPGIRGTYLLTHDIFMKQYLLPEFRALNRASDIVHKPLSFEIGKDDQLSGVIMHYGVGYDPEHPTDSDGVYDFDPVFDPNNERKVIAYRWYKKNVQNKNGPVEQEQKSPKTDCWGRAWTEGRSLSASEVHCDFRLTEFNSIADVMETTVKWSAGSPTVTLEGTAVSKEHSLWTPWGTKNFDNPTSSFQ
jgi:hypothetical protein